MSGDADVAASRQSGESSVLPEFSFAFQPIIDASAGVIVSYEALIRGPRNEPASSVLEQIGAHAMASFDGQTRLAAIELAARLGLGCHLNLNMLPRTVAENDAPLRSTVEVAERCGIPATHIVLEGLENDMIQDHVHFARVLNRYRALGLKVAIDDFGAGYSGLNLLADFQPDKVKLDMHLVRNIASRGPRLAIVRAIIMVCLDLGIDVLAEGVDLFQGYLFARPGFESLPGYCDPDSAR